MPDTAAEDAVSGEAACSQLLYGITPWYEFRDGCSSKPLYTFKNFSHSKAEEITTPNPKNGS
jgi:hypothetical protein